MKLYRLKNSTGIKVDISPVGASIVNFFVADKNGDEVNIVLGYDNEGDYREGRAYIGSVVGPFANRIDKGRFTLGGTEYVLTQNDGSNHLHGGDAGINYKQWEVLDHTDTCMVLRTNVKYGEGGYPANIMITVMYSIDDEGQLKISYVASPDRACPLNVTQHVYFNLNGSGTVLDHKVWMDADNFMPINERFIPLGTKNVTLTPFDFREPVVMGEAMQVEHDQIRLAGGFDHCWVLNDSYHKKRIKALGDKSGIRLSVETDLPGVQFYSGNFLNGEPGRNGEVYDRHGGFCFETQYFPNQVNTPLRDKCTFTMSNPFRSTTIYSVDVQ